MKFIKTMLLANVLLFVSCSPKADSKDHLYAFEASEAARKSWSNPPKEQAKTMNAVEEKTDSIPSDSIIQNSH